MPLFSWVGPFQVGWNLGRILTGELDRFNRDVEGEHFDVTVTKAEIELAGLLARRAAREETEEAKLARTRWLEANRAERSFPCGVVPDPVLEATDPANTAPRSEPERPLLPSDPGWAAPAKPVVAPPPAEPHPLPPLRPMQVIAAVLPTDLVFIREQGSDDEVEEVGRLPRSAIQDVDVVDAKDTHVPDPVRETIEPSQPVFTVLRWTNAGTPDEDRFLFRSPWMAWQAAHRLREAKRG